MKLNQFTSIKVIKNELDECLSYLRNYVDQEFITSKFILIPRLNLLIRADVNVSLYMQVTKEYKHNNSLITRHLAKLYIFLIGIFLKLKIAKYFFKYFYLRVPAFYPVILGGNNRFRLIDASNSFAIIVARDYSSIFYTKNAIRASKNPYYNDLKLIPKIFNLNSRIYYEKQIKGIAINRLHLEPDEYKKLKHTMQKFFTKQQTLHRKISKAAFFRYKEMILSRYVENTNITGIEKYFDLYKETIKKIQPLIRQTHIDVTLSHGDLNRGNIFFESSNIKFIDWEFYLYRYLPYDQIIFDYNLRHISHFEYKKLFSFKKDLYFNHLIFLIEELFFRVLNFKSEVNSSEGFFNIVNQLLIRETNNEDIKSA